MPHLLLVKSCLILTSLFLSSPGAIHIVKPRRGDALLFFSFHPNVTLDRSSAHAACPVIEGEKWSAVKWIHVNAFDEMVGGGGECSDQHENCASWGCPW